MRFELLLTILEVLHRDPYIQPTGRNIFPWSIFLMHYKHVASNYLYPKICVQNKLFTHFISCLLIAMYLALRIYLTRLVGNFSLISLLFLLVQEPKYELSKALGTQMQIWGREKFKGINHCWHMNKMYLFQKFSYYLTYLGKTSGFKMTV